jgi:hypothetical protein
MKMAELSQNTLSRPVRGRSSSQPSPFWAVRRGAGMPEDRSSYPSIADYALISDCRAVALERVMDPRRECLLPDAGRGKRRQRSATPPKRWVASRNPSPTA